MVCVAPCSADVILGLGAPLDNEVARGAVGSNPAFAAQMKEDSLQYDALETKLKTAGENCLKCMFSELKPQELEYAHSPTVPENGDDFRVPDGYVLPLHHTTFVGYPGILSRGDDGNHAPYFLKIGDVGGAQVVRGGGWNYIIVVVLYLKTDSAFKPFKNVADYAERRKWEIEHTNKLRDFIDAALDKYAREERVLQNRGLGHLEVVFGKYAEMSDYHGYLTRIVREQAKMMPEEKRDRILTAIDADAGGDSILVTSQTKSIHARLVSLAPSQAALELDKSAKAICEQFPEIWDETNSAYDFVAELAEVRENLKTLDDFTDEMMEALNTLPTLSPKQIQAELDALPAGNSN